VRFAGFVVNLCPRMENAELAVIINSFNRLALFRQSLSTLVSSLNRSGVPTAIIVFDAGSNDGTVEWLRQEQQRQPIPIILLLPEPGEPTSFSHGVNRGASHAVAVCPRLRHLFLYETDNCLMSAQPLLAARELLKRSPHLAACGFTVRKHDGSAAGVGDQFPTLKTFLLGQQVSFLLQREGTPPADPTAPFVLPVVYTSPLLIKADAWQRVGGFDEATFPFSECDVDLAYRLRQLGLQMAVLPTRDVIHDNQQQKSEWSATRSLKFYQARYRFFLKHRPLAARLSKPLLILMHLVELLLLAILVLGRKRKRQAVATRWLLAKSVLNNYEVRGEELGHPQISAD